MGSRFVEGGGGAFFCGLIPCCHRSFFVVQGWVKDFPNEPAFIVPESLKKKVAAGRLGRKSGHGYYTWDRDKPIAPSEEPLL